MEYEELRQYLLKHANFHPDYNGNIRDIIRDYEGSTGKYADFWPHVAVMLLPHFIDYIEEHKKR